MSLFFISINLHAQTNQSESQNSGLSVAILDLTSIRRDSMVVKNIREQIELFREGFRKNIQKEETALKAANQDLAKKRNILSPD